MRFVSKREVDQIDDYVMECLSLNSLKLSPNFNPLRLFVCSLDIDWSFVVFVSGGLVSAAGAAGTGAKVALVEEHLLGMSRVKALILFQIIVILSCYPLVIVYLNIWLNS